MERVYLYKNSQNEFTVKVRKKGIQTRYAYFSHIIDATDYIKAKGYENVTETF